MTDGRTIGRPYLSPEGTWFRVDTGPHGTEQRYFADGPDDSTAPAVTYNGNAQYDRRCTLCWLGFPHTLACHAARTKG